MENNIKASFLWNWTFSSRLVLCFTMAALFTPVLELNLSKLELPVEKLPSPYRNGALYVNDSLQK